MFSFSHRFNAAALGFLACLCLSHGLAAADGKTTAPKLSAAQVVEKHVAARGGLQAWRAVQSISFSGKMDAGGKHKAQLPFVLEKKRPRKERVELVFANDTAVQVYDGTNGWKLRPYLGRREVEPYSPEELKSASLESDIDGPLVDYTAKGNKVELEGVERVENQDAYKLKLTMKGGEVQRDETNAITKFAIVDRFSGEGRTSKMFWKGCGPRTPGTALACSVAHDKHNVWAVGSCDDAMAKAVNALVDQQGGWALVREGELVATVRYEIGGLMTCRPAEALDAEMQALYAEAGRVDWMYEPTFRPRWYPGFPERLMFATLTCAPWTWVLVAPCEQAPQGFLNVQTGAVHPVVW